MEEISNEPHQLPRIGGADFERLLSTKKQFIQGNLQRKHHHASSECMKEDVKLWLLNRENATSWLENPLPHKLRQDGSTPAWFQTNDRNVSEECWLSCDDEMLARSTPKELESIVGPQVRETLMKRVIFCSLRPSHLQKNYSKMRQYNVRRPAAYRRDGQPQPIQQALQTAYNASLAPQSQSPSTTPQSKSQAAPLPEPPQLRISPQEAEAILLINDHMADQEEQQDTLTGSAMIIEWGQGEAEEVGNKMKINFVLGKFETIFNVAGNKLMTVPNPAIMDMMMKGAVDTTTKPRQDEPGNMGPPQRPKGRHADCAKLKIIASSILLHLKESVFNECLSHINGLQNQAINAAAGNVIGAAVMQTLEDATVDPRMDF